ncbi:MAG: hypothetical protein JWP44_2431 [Mucilaginibacter sp.]|nr:hypothetical protein [Mucilaginibacter sp.]
MAIIDLDEKANQHKLIEDVLQIPDKIQYSVYAKSLLVEALHPLIPNEIVHRPKKGFTFPWIHWLKNELREFCELHLRLLGQKEQFSESRINSLLEDFLKNKNDVQCTHIWQLVVLENYLNENLCLYPEDESRLFYQDTVCY